MKTNTPLSTGGATPLKGDKHVKQHTRMAAGGGQTAANTASKVKVAGRGNESGKK